MRTRLLLIAVLSLAVLAALAARPATADLPLEPFTATSYWKTPSSAPADPRSGAMISWLSSMLKTDRRFVTIRATNLNGSSARERRSITRQRHRPAVEDLPQPADYKYVFLADRLRRRAHSPGAQGADRQRRRHDGLQRVPGKAVLVHQHAADQRPLVRQPGVGVLHRVERPARQAAAVRQRQELGQARPGAGDPGRPLERGGLRRGAARDGRLHPAVSCNNRHATARTGSRCITGTMCTTSATGSIPAGAVLRIKPTVDLSQYPLSPDARVHRPGAADLRRRGR